MKFLFLARVFSVATAMALSFSEAQAATRKFSIELESWTRLCRETNPADTLNCALPQAWTGTEKLDLEVQISEEVSETRLTKQNFGKAELRGELRFFSTYPHPDSGLPPYIQIQIEMIAPMRGLCLQSVRLRDPFLASPLACTSFDPATGQQIGVNLKLVEVSSK